MHADRSCALIACTTYFPRREPFSMIRGFHLADWFTLGNVVFASAALYKRGVNLGRVKSSMALPRKLIYGA